MNNYECKICKYLTKYKKDYLKHNKTQKHIKNVITASNSNNDENNIIESNSNGTQMEPKWNPNGTSNNKKKVSYVCKYCENVFSGANSLARHAKACYIKQEKENILEEKIRQLNEKLEKSELSTEHYKAENKYYKQMLYEAGGIVKKSVSSLTYAMDNYNTAPALKAITVEDIKYFDETEKK